MASRSANHAMITRFRVQNYKALRDVTLDLTPVHVLIGPNDSGKTSLLEAVAGVSRSVDHSVSDSFRLDMTGSTACFDKGFPYVTIEAHWNDLPRFEDCTEVIGHTATFRLARTTIHEPTIYSFGLIQPGGQEIQIRKETPKFDHQMGERTAMRNPRLAWYPINDIPENAVALVANELKGVQYYRFSPDWLKVPVTLSPQRQGRMEFNGFGLPQLLDEIRNDREGFAQLESRFTSFFPYILAVELPVRDAFEASAVDYRRVKPAEYTGGKGIEFRLDNGSKLPAENTSDGVMLVLAYLALLHLPNPPRFLLIEEPENGIHPARLKEIIRILKQLVSEQSHTQVLMTTHSPYVVHEFEPHEVTLCTRGEDGAVRTRRLSESKTVREQIDFFSLGEIWTQDGDEALMEPAQATAPTVSEEAAGA